MSLLLALNTAQPIHELALLQRTMLGDLQLLAERRWENVREDVEQLVPTLQALLEEAAVEKEQLTHFLGVKGPGPFTSLRVGLSFLNGLAEGLSLCMQKNALEFSSYSMDTFDLLAMKAACAQPLLVVLHAGGLDVGLRLNGGETQVGPLASLVASIPHQGQLGVVAELPETLRDELRSIVLEKRWHLLEQHELQTLGEALQSLSPKDLNAFESSDSIQPMYLRGAHITVSSNPWKKI